MKTPHEVNRRGRAQLENVRP